MTTMVNQPEVRGEDVPGRDQELLPQMSNLRKLTLYMCIQEVLAYIV